MKKILWILFVVCLTLFSSTCVFGAVHSSGERCPTDTWYAVTPQKPYWQLFYSTVLSSDTNFAGGELYQNDQTFLRVDSSHVMGIFRNTELVASYLFDSGFFAGVMYSKTNGSNATKLSPGYRFSFDANSYAAISLDYSSSTSTNKVTGYELNLRYYLDNAKFSGNIYTPVAGDATWDMGINFTVSKQFIVGCDYASQDKKFTTGFTYTVLPVIVDFKYYNSDVDEYGYYNLSGMFKLGENYGLGLQGYKFKDGDDIRFTAIFKFTAAQADFKVLFTPKNGSFDQSYSFAYYKTL